jgi:hypothetical protein
VRAVTAWRRADRPGITANLLATSSDKQSVARGALQRGGFSPGRAALGLLLAVPPVAKTQAADQDLMSLPMATRPLWGGWQISSSLYDALGRHWSSPAGPNDPEDQIQMDGRGWRLQVGYRLPVRGGRREP